MEASTIKKKPYRTRTRYRSFKNKRYTKVHIYVNVTRSTHSTRFWGLVSWVVEGTDRGKMILDHKMFRNRSNLISSQFLVVRRVLKWS